MVNVTMHIRNEGTIGGGFIAKRDTECKKDIVWIDIKDGGGGMVTLFFPDIHGLASFKVKVDDALTSAMEKAKSDMNYATAGTEE